jgi:2-polyprenyl-3-methyl-5-hydroxy-6-metoxy-1,4-benzoquinol methylase
MKFLKKVFSYIRYLLTKPFKKPPVLYQLNADFIIPIIKKEVRKDVVTVLDVGCGMLYDNNPASEDILLSCFDKKPYQVTGLDISEEAIAWRKKGHPKGEYFVMDACNLNSLTQRFDLVIAHHVIEHVTKEEGLTLLINNGL